MSLDLCLFGLCVAFELFRSHVQEGLGKENQWWRFLQFMQPVLMAVMASQSITGITYVFRCVVIVHYGLKYLRLILRHNQIITWNHMSIKTKWNGWKWRNPMQCYNPHNWLCVFNRDVCLDKKHFNFFLLLSRLYQGKCLLSLLDFPLIPSICLYFHLTLTFPGEQSVPSAHGMCWVLQPRWAPSGLVHHSLRHWVWESQTHAHTDRALTEKNKNLDSQSKIPWITNVMLNRLIVKRSLLD